MSLQQESQVDLSVDADSAEEIVGGSEKTLRTKRSTKLVTSAVSPITVAPSYVGLRMGPDPSYPDADSGTQDC